MDNKDETQETNISFSEPFVGDRETEQVSEVIESNWLSTGPKTEMFERKIAKYTDSNHAVGTTNCTSALYLSLRSLQVDGEVITSPMTFATTVSACNAYDVRPVLADVRPTTLTLDPASVKEAITGDTAAIMPVHYAGQAANMDALRELAADHDLALIEDAAHGLGGFYNGEALGTIGDTGCFSFYATKTITTGEGGMLVTDDSEVADRARNLRLAGIDKDAWEREVERDAAWTYDVVANSLKYNMNDIQAAIGIAQMEKLPEILDSRRDLANRYDDALQDVSGITPLAVRDPEEHARHLYPVFVEESAAGIDRNELAKQLTERNIDTSVHYIPIHYHSAFDGIKRTNLENAEKAYEQVLCLPLHPGMTEQDVTTVVETLGAITNSAYSRT